MKERYTSTVVENILSTNWGNVTGGQVPCHIDTFFFMEYNEFNSGNIYGGSPHFPWDVIDACKPI